MDATRHYLHKEAQKGKPFFEALGLLAQRLGKKAAPGAKTLLAKGAPQKVVRTGSRLKGLRPGKAAAPGVMKKGIRGIHPGNRRIPMPSTPATPTLVPRSPVLGQRPMRTAALAAGVTTGPAAVAGFMLYRGYKIRKDDLQAVKAAEAAGDTEAAAKAEAAAAKAEAAKAEAAKAEKEDKARGGETTVPDGTPPTVIQGLSDKAALGYGAGGGFLGGVGGYHGAKALGLDPGGGAILGATGGAALSLILARMAAQAGKKPFNYGDLSKSIESTEVEAAQKERKERQRAAEEKRLKERLKTRGKNKKE